MQMSGDKRRTKRNAVLKTAKVEWGTTVVDCLVLEQSVGGIRVSMSVPMEVPERVTVHLRGGAVRPAVRRWARGTEIGFKFFGIAELDADAADNALAILVDLPETALNDVIRRLKEVRFFDDVELNVAALEAQAALQRFEAMLRRQAEGD